MRKSLRRNDGGNIVHVTSCQLTIDPEKHRKWDSNKKRRLHYLDRSKAGQGGKRIGIDSKSPPSKNGLQKECIRFCVEVLRCARVRRA